MTQTPPDHCKEMQTEVVWRCLPFIRSGQNRLARHGERRKKRQTEKKVGRQHHRMHRLGACQVPEDCREQTKVEGTGCEITYGAPMTLTFKG